MTGLMETKDRSKVVATTIVLTIQLKNWVSFARDMGAMSNRFKYLSGILLSALNNLLKFLFEGHTTRKTTRLTSIP